MDDVPFVITVVRSGGFAGLRREWTIEVVAPEQAERWHPLIDACPWDHDGYDTGRRDGYVYDLRVADLAAEVPESRLEGPWRDLVDEVQRQSS